MYQEPKKFPKKIILILGIIIVFLIIILSFLLKPESITFTITNKSDYLQNASDSSQNNLESAILSYEQKNYGLKKSAEGIIRDLSYKEYIDTEIYNSSFLLDIPELKQTLKILFTWSKDQNPLNETLTISCPSIKETAYPEFACFDPSTQETIITGNEEDQQEKNKKSPIIISGLEFLIKRGYSRINQETVYSSLKVFFETNYPDFTRINLDTTSYHYDSSDKSLSFFNVISNTEEAFEVKIKTISLQEIEISINPLP